MILRTDRADSPLSAPIRHADGRVTYEGVIARPGIYIYVEDGVTIREFVPAETLSDPAWLAELGGCSLVIEHPFDEKGESMPVDGKNFRTLAVGSNLDARVGPDGVIIGRLTVTADEGHAAIAAGKVGLSPRYACEISHTPGEDPRYGVYDRIQTRRFRTDQIALCDSPRGGPVTTIRRDSADGVLMDPKEALLAALKGLGVPDDKLAAVMALIEQALAGAAAGEGAGEEGAADPMAMLDARMTKLESMLAAKADAKPNPEVKRLSDAVVALTRKVDGLTSELNRVDSVGAAARKVADRQELVDAASRLRHAVTDSTTWVTLAKAAGSVAENLSEEAAREVVRVAARQAADPRYDGLRSGDTPSVTADSYSNLTF